MIFCVLLLCLAAAVSHPGEDRQDLVTASRRRGQNSHVSSGVVFPSLLTEAGEINTCDYWGGNQQRPHNTKSQYKTIVIQMFCDTNMNSNILQFIAFLILITYAEEGAMIE